MDGRTVKLHCITPCDYSVGGPEGLKSELLHLNSSCRAGVVPSARRQKLDLAVVLGLARSSQRSGAFMFTSLLIHTSSCMG